MIPKIIHYCWFGHQMLPESAQKCIASWRRFFPDYEIIEWNEENFDINEIPYTSEAYGVGKYAFVSDYARFKILYEHGGLYFDTDVEIICSLDDIIAHGPFMGVEVGPCDAIGYTANNDNYFVAPGLGLGAKPGMPLYKQIIEHYQTIHFIINNTFNTKTVGEYTTEILLKSNLKKSSQIQTVEDITIYPPDYFNPLDDSTGRMRLTNNTRCIHWYAKSWLNQSPWHSKISRLFHRIFGTQLISKVRKLFML